MKTRTKWYDDLQMVGTLLMFWPPLGLYGVYRSTTMPKAWKHIAYGTFAVACALLVAIQVS